MTIRLRLTLVYSGILALILVIFGVGLYSIQSQDTLNALKDDLISSSNQFADVLQRTPVIIFSNEDLPGNPPPPRTFNQFSDAPAFQDVREREILRVLDPDGNLLASPFGQAEDALPLSAEALKAMLSREPVFEIGSVAEQNMLIYSRPIFRDGQLAYIIQVARSLTERNRTLNSLATILSIAGSATILFAFAAGWVLSGLALRPIDRITQTAHTIGEERNFTRRVDHTGQQDEVGKLANTFNQMLAQLQNAYQKIELALKQQRNFVSDVSHELRTPLTTLRGNLSLLQRQPPAPPDEQADILADMVDESDRMIRLVNGLLLLAHADAGRSLAKENIAVTEVIEETIRQVNHLEMDREITTNLSPRLSILGDRDAFKQVLLILLDNGLKYSEDMVTICTRLLGGQVVIQVEDRGRGIPAEELAHVFERFYRAEDTATIQGFGLGLPIAKSLVEAMDGEIAIESVIGKGSILSITFPAIAN
jgi:signal transduction histidine kinase